MWFIHFKTDSQNDEKVLKDFNDFKVIKVFKDIRECEPRDYSCRSTSASRRRSRKRRDMPK